MKNDVQVRGGQGGKVEEHMRAGDLTPSPNLPVGGNKWRENCLGIFAGGQTAREVKVYSEITGFDRDMVENRRPFGKGGCRCGPSVIPGGYRAIPGLEFSLGILERCSVDAHTRGIPFVRSTLFLGTLCCRHPPS